MEIKKYPKVDLENYRNLFFLIGLVLALILVYGLFEWKTYNVKVQDLSANQQADFEQEDVPVTTREIKVPPPPAPKQVVSDAIQIVKNNAKIEEQFDFNVEADENEAVDFSDVNFDTTQEEDDDEQIFVSVQQMPEFPGGIMALRRYIAEHIQYPVLAQENEIEGTVVVKFVVGKKGEVSNVQVIRGVDPLLDSEAVRVVRTLPRFKPGYNNGRPVKVWYTLPIIFKLQKN